MRRGMAAPSGIAALVIDFGGERLSDGDFAFAQKCAMNNKPRDRLLRVINLEANAGCGEHAAITDLAARFTIERRSVENDLDVGLVELGAGFRAGTLDEGASLENGHHAPFAD